MNKGDFIKSIKEVNSIGRAQSADLKRLTKDFPYCQSAQILLAKSLFNSSDISFEKQLRVAAAYAGNRQLLHQLILEKSTTYEKSITNKVTKTKELDKKDSTKSIDIKSESTPDISSPTEKIEQKESEEVQDHTHNAFESDNTHIEKSPDEIKLDKQILTEVLYHTYGLEDIPETEIQKETEVDLDYKEANFNSQGHSYCEWLNHIDEKTSNAPIKYSKETQKSELITNFIKNEPQIKPKKEFYSAVNMARLSVKENDDLVTETLAKIYAYQGHIEKAILTYKKLALKYPEKRIYFANQINKLGEDA